MLNVEGGITKRTGSLRDALTRKLPLVYTCLEEDKWKQFQPIACTKPHRYEFVGIWMAPDAPSAEMDPERARRECYALIARYIGVPKQIDMEYQTGVRYIPPNNKLWQRGEHGVKCFLWSDQKPLTRSLKGTGLDFLPL